MHRFVSVICFSLALCVIGGCSSPQQSPAPPTAPVKGTVSLDGKPMDTGEIRFGVMGQPPKISPIKGGEFSGEAYVGKNQVEVVLMVDGPASSTDPKDISKINMIADKYSGPGTSLSAEVGKAGASDLKFVVTSK